MLENIIFVFIAKIYIPSIVAFVEKSKTENNQFLQRLMINVMDISFIIDQKSVY